MNTTIEIDKQTYSLGKLDALRQFHITRRLGPLFATMGISLTQLKLNKDMDLDDFAPLLGPVSDMLSRMSNEDSEYIIFTCLSVVRRVGADSKAAPITNGHLFMFDDIGMTTMLRLTVEVMKDSLGGFLQGLGADATLPSS